jgi:membrane protease YdiL (CAAX protease family)
MSLADERTEEASLGPVTASPLSTAASAARHPLDGVALLFAMVFPSVMTWLEFVVLPGQGQEHNPALQVLFAAGKLVQFSFPLLYVGLTRPLELRPGRPRANGLLLGAGFGLLVSAGALLLYALWLKETPLFAATAGKVHRWLTEFNLATRGGFLAMAAFIAILHSFLEEYYWRWFVFGRLERYLPVPAAMLLSSLAFMSHHVILLSVYLPGGERFLLGVIPFSLCVAAGGIAWAWLYHRTQSLYGPWISHLLVDMALMGIGYDMLTRYW